MREKGRHKEWETGKKKHIGKEMIVDIQQGQQRYADHLLL